MSLVASGDNRMLIAKAALGRVGAMELVNGDNERVEEEESV